MSILLIIAFVGLLILLNFFINLKEKRLNIKLSEEVIKKDIDRKSTCKKIEHCWCTKYDFDEEKVGQVLKEYGNHHCGKTVNSILNS